MKEKTKTAALQRLREQHCKLSRAKFAALVGSKEVTIEKIEYRENKMSEDTARLIEAATGASAEALRRDCLVDLSGRRYTKKTWEHWSTGPISNYEAKYAAQNIGKLLNVLLIGAREAPATYRAFAHQLNQFFDTSIRTIGTERLNENLEKSGEYVLPKRPMTVKKLRNLGSKELSKQLTPIIQTAWTVTETEHHTQTGEQFVGNELVTVSAVVHLAIKGPDGAKSATGTLDPRIESHYSIRFSVNELIFSQEIVQTEHVGLVAP